MLNSGRMKAKVIYFKAFVKDEYENMVCAQVRYNGKDYVCCATCWHWFDGDKYLVKHINTFTYQSTVNRKSKTRDMAIKRAIEEIRYTL